MMCLVKLLFIVGSLGVVGAVEMVWLIWLRVKFEGFEQFLAVSVCIELLKRKLR